jgi:2-polyprenyl-3-methyl-5-hydroxy-6-metoxy-1,4-benzoquinol methylase
MTKNDTYYSGERRDVAQYVPAGTKTLLDVCCGFGRFLHYLKQRDSIETWGVEAVREVAEEASKNGVDHVLSGKIEDVVASIPDGYFDCITFNDVLEHLLEPEKVLELMKPKLSANGVLIASIPNVRYFNNLRNLIIKKDWKYKDSGILDSTHFRFFTLISMKRMFETNEFSIVSVHGINPKPGWKFKLINFLTMHFFDDTQYLQYVIVAKKNG